MLGFLIMVPVLNSLLGAAVTVRSIQPGNGDIPQRLAHDPCRTCVHTRDDGVIDGSGLQGDDFFSGFGNVRLTFDPASPNGLPTQVRLPKPNGKNACS